MVFGCLDRSAIPWIALLAMLASMSRPAVMMMVVVMIFGFRMMGGGSLCADLADTIIRQDCSHVIDWPFIDACRCEIGRASTGGERNIVCRFRSCTLYRGGRFAAISLSYDRRLRLA